MKNNLTKSAQVKNGKHGRSKPKQRPASVKGSDFSPTASGAKSFSLGVRCETCGSISGLTPSHFVRKSHVHKSKYGQYDYNSTDNYFTQCLDCHRIYEDLGVHRKFPDQILRQDYMRDRGFLKYAERIEYLIGASE